MIQSTSLVSSEPDQSFQAQEDFGAFLITLSQFGSMLPSVDQRMGPSNDDCSEAFWFGQTLELSHTAYGQRRNNFTKI